MAARPMTPPENQEGSRQPMSAASVISPAKRPRDVDEGGSPPTTPSKRARSGEDLNVLLNNLSGEFEFNLRGQDWTPSSRRGSIEEECRSIIQILYYHEIDGLLSCIEKFRTVFSKKDRTLSSFAQLLKAQRETSQLSPRHLRSANSSRTTSANTSFAGSVHRLDTAQTSFSGSSQEARTDLSVTGATNISSGTLSPSSQEAKFLADNWEAISGPITTLKPKISTIERTEPPKTKASKQRQISEFLTTVTEEPHVHYKIRNLSSAGLFVDDIPITIRKASPRIRYEMVRIGNDCKVSLRVLSTGYTEKWEEYDVFHAKVRDNLSKDTMTAFPQSSRRAWNSASPHAESEHVVRTAKLVFETDTDPKKPLFKLKLNPLSYEPTSTRFFRRFGAHRFLKVFIPTKTPAKIGNNHEALRKGLLNWLDQADKSFMGYHWNAFHTKFKKEKRKRRNRHKAMEESPEYQVYFFATSGVNLQTYTISDLLNWFMPIDRNLQQPYCKAYARLELGLSMTYATLMFKPSQIKTVHDTFANGDAADYSYDDHTLSWPIHKVTGEPKVMNDGCARISTAAAKKVWATLKQTGYCPSAFQARIGCWKGLWFVDECTTSSNDDIWIQVTDSQRKFERHLEDYDEDAYDRHRTTFEVVAWSRKPSPSEFYLEYFPILEDRGVPRDIMQTYVLSALRTAFEDVEAAIENPATLLKWLDDNCSILDGVVDGKGAMVGAMPKSNGGRVKRLLESGFMVGEATHESSYLSDIVLKIMTKRFTEISSALEIPLPRSTCVFGIADPSRSLLPNEIHFVASEAMSDEPSPFLHNVEVLVARHPALRRSDIQKVRAIFKPELRHIVNVVVFSANGIQPLASKLQGGDYDGDMFWLCWQEEIVQSFRNAPAPMELPPPECFGIEVDRRKLGDMFIGQAGNTNVEFMKDFLRNCFLFAWHFSYLGTCTNYLNELSYSTNTISSESFNSFVDLHDHLVDSAKNGYVFGDKQWITIKNKLTGKKTRMLKPAYKEAPKKTLSLSEFRNSTKFPGKSGLRHNVVDFLVFDVARPYALSKLDNLDKNIKADQKLVFDPNIARLRQHTLLIEEDPIRSVAHKLREDIDRVYIQYAMVWGQRRDVEKQDPTGEDARRLGGKTYDELIMDAYKDFQQILPAEEHLDHPAIRSMLDRQAKHCPSYWQCLKASFVAKTFKQHFAFGVAGDEICHMKAHASEIGRPRSVVLNMIRHMKIKHIRDETIIMHQFGPTTVDQDVDDWTEDSEDDVLEGMEECVSATRKPQTQPAFGLDGTSEEPPLDRSAARQERDVSPSPRPKRTKLSSSRSLVQQPSPSNRMHIDPAQYSIITQLNFHVPKATSNTTPPLDPESCSEESDFHDALELALVDSAGPKPVGQQREFSKADSKMKTRVEMKAPMEPEAAFKAAEYMGTQDWEMQVERVRNQMASQHLNDEVEAAYRALLEAEAEIDGQW